MYVCLERTHFFTQFIQCLCNIGGSEDKVSACNVGDRDSIPGLGRSPGVRGVAKSWT